MLSENVIISILSLVGGIAIAFIGAWGGKKLTKEADTPKNRADAVFDGYDMLIDQLKAELDRKNIENADLLSRNRQLTMEISQCRHDHHQSGGP